MIKALGLFLESIGDTACFEGMICVKARKSGVI
jgi:hypothetical protein